MLTPPVSRYMTREPRSLPPSASVSRALELMATHAIRHIPVIDEGRLVGVVGEGELRVAEALPSVDSRALELSSVMTKPLCVQGETLLDEVSELMSADKAECVVVIGPDGVSGIFTAVDALRALQDLIERA